MDPLNQRPTVEFLILADRAEAVNGKLYMMGGGWDRLNVLDLNQPSNISFAVSVLIPWIDTNTDHRLTIWVEHEDGTRLQPQIDATMNVGRPPYAIQGQPFRTLIAINGVWKFPNLGTYRMIASIGESGRKDYVFHVVPANPIQPPPQ